MHKPTCQEIIGWTFSIMSNEVSEVWSYGGLLDVYYGLQRHVDYLLTTRVPTAIYFSNKKSH